MNKKKSIVNLLIGVLIGCIVSTSATAYGATTLQSINVVFDKVNLKVNGQPVSTPNILYNDTTYVPMRMVANMLGKEVGWDGTTNTASINDPGYVEPTKPSQPTNQGGNDSVNRPQSESMTPNEIISTMDYITIKSTNETYYTVAYILILLEKHGDFFIRQNQFLENGRLTFIYSKDESVLIDNVPYRTINGNVYVSKTYYENTILPLVD